MVLLIQMPLPASAADWTRFKRLRGSNTYATTLANKTDVINHVTAGNPFNHQTHQSRVVGSSRTRREASKWIDYVGSQHETFITRSVNYQSAPTGTQLSVTRLCSCQTSVLGPRTSGCNKCKYV